MRPPVVPPELLAAPFRSAQAAAYGLTHRHLQGPAWRRVFHDVYVHRSHGDSSALRLAAARLVLPDDAVIAGDTAAWLHGADVRSQHDLRLEAAFPPGRPIVRNGVRVRQLALTDADIVVLGSGLRVTSPVRTAFDLACVPNLTDAVVAVDALANRGGCGLDDLAAYAAERRGARCIRTLDRALELADPGSQSPQESRLRLQLLDGGLPRPQTQVQIVDDNGRLVAVLDVGWRQWRVGCDYDGEVHAPQWAADVRRQEAIRDLGWWHRRFVAADLRTPALNVALVRSALLRAGWRP
jgi:YD repeat-containing protein